MAKKTIITKEVPLPVDTLVPHISYLQQRNPKFLYQGAWNMPDGSVLVQFKTTVSAASWGDVVDVNLYRDPSGLRCTVTIKSESIMPTQIIDFGHGKRIVREVEQDIDNFVNSFGVQPAQQ